MAFPIISATEAAQYIKNGDNIGLSGFTACGTPKAVPEALAEIATKEHAEGREFKVSLFTGASTNDHVDGALSRANAIDKRSPYQSTSDSRKGVNARDISYFDLHLSEMAQKLRYGFYGPMNVGIIEVADIDSNGDAVLGTGVGMSQTVAMMADKIIIERNQEVSPRMRGVHDLAVPQDPPYRREIGIYKASDRIGSPVLHIDPAKIVGIVETNAKDGAKSFTAPDEVSQRIAANVCDLLASDLRAGRIPKEFLPLQSGVGNVANAVLFGLAERDDIPAFEMYTEVVQDAVVGLMESGKCKFASACSMSFSDEMMDHVFANMDFFHDRVVLRPGEISNSPEVVRRLGIIAMNTALEADIFGNVNSTHVTGTKMMNGIGGSGDFTRNSYLSIFSCPSVTKGGAISNIVPMVSHVDHTEHSVDVIITDQGVADLRGKSPIQRAHEIIENCAHPDYRPLLRDYLSRGAKAHTPHCLCNAFAFHEAFIQTGDMRNAKFV